MMKSMRRVRTVAEMQANLNAPLSRVGSSSMSASYSDSVSSAWIVGRTELWGICEIVRDGSFFSGSEGSGSEF